MADLILSSSKTLTAANVNNLTTVPVNIIPAVAAGMAIDVLQGTLNYIHGSAAFTVSGAEAIILVPTGTVDDLGLIIPTIGLLDQAVNTVFMGTASPQFAFASTDILQNGVDILNNSANATSGGAGSTLVVTLYYRVVPIQ